MMAEQPHTPEQDRLLAARESAADFISRWSKIMFGMAAGLVLLAFAPDSLVISDSAKTEMPFIGSASIKLVLIAGPLLLLCVRFYVSSHLRQWNSLTAELGDLIPRQDATLHMKSKRRLPNWVGVVNFPLVAVVLIISTCKGLAFPLWGEAMAVLTVGVIAWLTYGAARSGRWLALTMMLFIIVGTLAVIDYELMEPIAKAAVYRNAEKAPVDPNEDKYRGSFFWVFCSSPNRAGPGRQGNADERASEIGKKGETKAGCIGEGDDWSNGKEKKKEQEQEQEQEQGQDEAQTFREKISSAFENLDRFYVIQRQLNLSGEEMLRADLRRMNLHWASMTHADLSNSLFRKAQLQHAIATKAKFEGADFGGAQMQYINLRRANLNDTSFWGANLTGATLRGAHLKEANLKTADLTDADLTRADMEGADLRSTILKHAKLQKANMRYAMFGKLGTRRNRTATDLTGAQLECADLRGVDLSHAKGLDKDQVKKACMDGETKLPPELEGVVRKIIPQGCKLDKRNKKVRCRTNRENR